MPAKLQLPSMIRSELRLRGICKMGFKKSFILVDRDWTISNTNQPLPSLQLYTPCTWKSSRRNKTTSEKCLTDKANNSLVHFYKRCVSNGRCLHLQCFFSGQWKPLRPMFTDSPSCLQVQPRTFIDMKCYSHNEDAAWFPSVTRLLDPSWQMSRRGWLCCAW